MSVQPASQPPEAVPFWDAVARGELAVQRCAACGRLRFPPSPRCSTCASDAADWVPVSGRGRVLSWTRTHHAFDPAFRDRLPYTVVLVGLDEQPGLAMFGNIYPERDIQIGTRVRAVFPDAGADALVQWEPSS